MKKLNFYWQVYKVYLSSSIKKSMEYRMDFFIGALSLIVEQCMSLAFIMIVFSHIPSLQGWTLGELIVMYAFASMGRSIHMTFFDSFWIFGWYYVRAGRFDSLLVKPMNPLVQVIFERIQYKGIFQMITGIIALIYSFNLLGIPFSLLNCVMIIVFTLASAAVYVGINLFFMVFSFWMSDSLPLIIAMFSFDQVSRYPVTIFPPIIAGFLTFVLPYAFTAYYPATFFFAQHFSYLSLATPFVGSILCLGAYRFWLFGMKHYSGAGN